MLFSVSFAGVGSVLGRVVGVSGGGVSVVSSFLVAAGLVVPSGLSVLLGSFGVVVGSLLVAVSGFLGHGTGILSRSDARTYHKLRVYA